MRHPPLNAKNVLDAVDRWATGCWMLREIELLGTRPEDVQADPYPYDKARRQRVAVAAGRVDALLVPVTPWEAPWTKKIGGWAWAAARLVGVEVKMTRSDFKQGLNKGQFDRYAAELGGLYLATPAGLVKSAEVPANFGHLVVSGHAGNWVAACRRHPEFKDVQATPEMLWKVLSIYAKQQRAEHDALAAKVREGCQKAGRRLAAAIAEARQ